MSHKWRRCQKRDRVVFNHLIRSRIRTMTAEMISCWLFACVLLCCHFTIASSGCNSIARDAVCHTVLKVTDSQIINDADEDKTKANDPYCDCDQCPLRWSTGSNALTWYHYRRKDFQVQYQFCTDVISQKKCSLYQDVGAIIRVNNSHWQPYLIQMNCHCKQNVYHLKQWMFDAKMEWWDYTYKCHQPVCTRGDMCVRHYMDRGQSRTLGYQFLCSCPKGYQCPLAKDGVRVQSLIATGQDATGPFLESLCEPIPGWSPEDQVTEDDEL